MQHVAEAYATVEKSTATGRRLEASALFRVARALQTAHDQWGQPGGEQRTEEALKLNQRLWTLFQAELSAQDNPLPPELKWQLLQLVEFIDRQTFDALAYPAQDKIPVLININRNIAAGLSLVPEGVAA